MDKKVMATPLTKEGAVLSSICEYLALKGYFFSRTNNTPIFDKTRGAFRALPKYTRKGWPDVCLIHQGTFYGIEAKSAEGRLSEEQKQIQKDIEVNGGRYVVARSVDDLIAAGL